MNKFRVIILHNIISPYKTLLFNALNKDLSGNLKVLYFAETEGNREWRVDKDKLQFAFDVMFKEKIDNISPIKLATKIYKRLNLYNPDVIIIGGYNRLACWTALFWAKKHKQKAIVMVESHYLDKPRSMLKENIKKLFVSNCKAALVAGTRHRDYMISLGMKLENIFTMKGVGGVDRRIYERDVTKFRKDKPIICSQLGVTPRNFLFIGRFSPEKNIIFLLKAYKRLKEKGTKEWGLILVGNGPQTKEIENFISSNKLKGVFLPGFKQKEELPLFYTISDVFILPSVSESWGLVVEEAITSGLPVLVSNRCGCYPDIVQDGINGFSFDPFDEDSLFKLMRDITQGKYNLKKMGRASSNIIKQYTTEKTVKIFMEAINFVMSKR